MVLTMEHLEVPGGGQAAGLDRHKSSQKVRFTFCLTASGAADISMVVFNRYILIVEEPRREDAGLWNQGLSRDVLQLQPVECFRECLGYIDWCAESKFEISM